MSETGIYLDYAATSPVDPRVAEVISECLAADAAYANPSSDHAAGRRAARLIEVAAEKIREQVGGRDGRLVFTSGATEANNLALAGLWRTLPVERRHIVSTRIEHRSVLDTLSALSQEGAKVTLLDCDRVGRIDAGAVAAALSDETGLVSVMHVNNEIGSIQPIEEIAALCLERNIPLHIDAAQSAGKIALKLDAWGVRLCSLNAHKINGPKGVGALYLGNDIELAPILYGGEQQDGIRPGTLATHQIAGMGRAFELARPDEEGPRLRLLLEALWLGLSDIPGIQRAGDPAHTAPHILNVSFGGVDGESLRLALGDVAVSSGSACNSPSPDASYVLTSLGLSDARAQGSVRFGIGRFTTEDEIGSATARVQAAVRQLRACADGSPDWCRV